MAFPDSPCLLGKGEKVKANEQKATGISAGGGRSTSKLTLAAFGIVSCVLLLGLYGWTQQNSRCMQSASVRQVHAAVKCLDQLNTTALATSAALLNANSQPEGRPPYRYVQVLCSSVGAPRLEQHTQQHPHLISLCDPQAAEVDPPDCGQQEQVVM